MHLLSLNAGSSSLRFVLFDAQLKELYRGHVDAIGQKHCVYRDEREGVSRSKKILLKDHQKALEAILDFIKTEFGWPDLTQIDLIVHRVVHGGEVFKKATLINAKVLKKIAELAPLAPLHNPIQLEVIRSAQKKLAQVPAYAVFDTAFHQNLPEKAFLYGLPYSFYKKHQVRRYGFHGTSHAYVSAEVKRYLKKNTFKLINCHMGNGTSLAAIKNGVSIDTTMGFTPLEGPIMGTRSGTMDPAILFYLNETLGYSMEQIKTILEKESGFKGLSGISSDVRDLWARHKSPETSRVFGVLSHQISKLIASLSASLEGLDVLVFTAGIGENAYYLREMICKPLAHLGLSLDAKANKKNAFCISKAHSKVKILVIPCREEWQMGKEALAAYKGIS